MDCLRSYMVAFAFCMAGATAAATDGMVTEWAVWGPAWGRAGLSALGNRLETRIQPTPGDVAFSWGTDRRRCLVWRQSSPPDGRLDFYSEAVLPGVTRTMVKDTAGHWAGGTAYAHTYLHSGSKQQVLLHIRSEQPASVWLNGAEQAIAGSRSQATLRKGWNRLLVKVLSPSNIRSVGARLPENGRPSNWTLAVWTARLDGTPVPGLRVQARDPERSRAVPLRYLTRLRSGDGRQPLFVRGESTDLVLQVKVATGTEAGFPANPWDRFRGKPWTYSAAPVAGAEAPPSAAVAEFARVAARKVAVALYDFDGREILTKTIDLQFGDEAGNEAVLEVPLFTGALPVGHYSLTTDFLDGNDGVQARDHEHAVAVVWGPVETRQDAARRRLSCVGHWLAARKPTEDALEKLEWLHRVGVTQHQKLCQAWSVWGVKHDGNGKVMVGKAPAIDALVERATALNIRLIGDLTFGYARSDTKRDGQNMALIAEEQDAAARQARLETAAEGIRLVPFGAGPLPPYGTKAFERTLHDYAFGLVSKYKDQIKLWCGDNEVDLHAGAATPAVATVYARASRILYAAMKEADPEAEFITASLVRRSAFTNELLRQGYAQCAEIVDVHAHPYRSPRLADSVIGNSGGEGLGVVLPHLDGPARNCRVVYGELSSPLAHATNGVLGQADGVHKQLAWALKHPIVESLAYLVLYDNGANLGFCNVYGDPLPANNAINVASHLLDGRLLLPDIEGLPAGTEQVRVAGDDDRETLLLWRATPTEARVRCATRDVMAFDRIGRETPLRVRHGAVVQRIGPEPVLLQGRFR